MGNLGDVGELRSCFADNHKLAELDFATHEKNFLAENEALEDTFSPASEPGVDHHNRNDRNFTDPGWLNDNVLDIEVVGQPLGQRISLAGQAVGVLLAWFSFRSGRG